jgi:hypothetical protein
MIRLSQGFSSAKPILPGIGHWAGDFRFHGPILQLIEFIDVRRDCFVRTAATKQFEGATKPFFAGGAELRKPQRVIKPPTNNGG